MLAPLRPKAGATLTQAMAKTPDFSGLYRLARGLSSGAARMEKHAGRWVKALCRGIQFPKIMRPGDIVIPSRKCGWDCSACLKRVTFP